MGALRYGICSYCGACIAACPFLALVLGDESPSRLEEKCLEKGSSLGLCSRVCPMVSTPEPERELPVLKAYTARTRIEEVREVCQDGGVVSTLLIEALRRGLVEAAITCALGEEPLKPYPKISTTERDVIESAGSKYSLVPVLYLLREASSRYSRIAVVGLPCHVRALELMRELRLRKLVSPVKYVIGLFCMGNYRYKTLVESIIAGTLGLDPREVLRVDIRKGKLTAYCRDGTARSVKASELRRHLSNCCRKCVDLTAVYADVSVGSMGSEDGWSTVLVRTEAGAELFDAAIEDGLLEARSLGEKQLEFIEKMSELKRRRASALS